MATVEVLHYFFVIIFHYLFWILDILTYLTQLLVMGLTYSLSYKHRVVNYSSTLFCLLVHSIVFPFAPRLCIHIVFVIFMLITKMHL